MRMAPEVKGRLTAGVLQFDSVLVSRKSAEVWQELQTLEQELRTRFGAPEQTLPALRPARVLYRQLGLDPTKHRPSSEALLRRVLKGEELYQINSVVDTCNLCSLRFLLPIGLYDIAKIVGGQVLARLGRAGEGYEAIGKGRIAAEGKLVLVDGQGPFGNPSADSARTMITEATREVMMVIFAPAEYPSALLQEHMSFAVARMERYGGARLHASSVVR